MSSVSPIDDPRAQDAAGSVPDDSADRRQNERQIATFRTGCVVVDGEPHPAILRNMSDGGAMFETLVAAKPDMPITYWWDGIDPVEARVAWVKGTRIGVANLSGPAERVDVPRPRATRVPARMPVRIWSGATSRKAELDNISLSGIALTGLDGIAPGTLCTIEIGGHTLHNASVVRTDGGTTGIRFERPLSPARLMQLLDGEGSVAHVDTRPAALCQVPHGEKGRKPEPAQPEADTPAPAPLRRFL